MIWKPPGNDAAGYFLQCFGVFQLLLDDLSQPSGEREVAAFAVFGFARIKPQPAASLHVGMMFLPGENLVMNAPAADVCRLDWGLQIRR
jgi:hypothetical protein